MQPRFTPIPYFAFGPPIKSSLIAHFCRENNYIHLKSPEASSLQPQALSQNCIIEGSLDLFRQIQKLNPHLEVIFVGSQFAEQLQLKVLKQYCAIGKCRRVLQLTEQTFRKVMYPNLIFFYGANQQQVLMVGQIFARNARYFFTGLPSSANHILQNFTKSEHYVIDGLFLDVKEIKVLEQYFNFRVIHLSYDRDNLQGMDQFFDREVQVLKYLKGKPYYRCIQAAQNLQAIMEQLGQAICPELIYVNVTENQQYDYLNQYLNQTNGLLLGTVEIMSTLKRKNLPLALSSEERAAVLTSIVLRDLSRKQIVIMQFPFRTYQFLNFQKMTRKFKAYVDLVKPAEYEYEGGYSSQIYYLEAQKRITPHMESSLQEELKQLERTDYWVVQGPACVGKSTVAKFIASEFGYKLVEFEPFLAGLKEKLLTPEDGEELPVKKICAHVKKMIDQDCKSKDIVYIFDGFPYHGADLQQWLQTVGPMNVINLKADQRQLIKRTRKKAEGDLNAEVSEEESAKAKETLEKNLEWVSNVSASSISSKIFQIDYSMPQLLSEEVICSALRPRVFLVQRHQSLTYQNLAIRYNMGFVNLARNPLRSIAPIVKRMQKRDVILCYYGNDSQDQSSEEKIVSEDLYWIQKNIGTLRYLAITENQTKIIEEQKMELQRPPKEEKPKRAVGEDGQQEPPPEQEPQGEEGAKKKPLDIYQFEWTKPKDHKNLSQWFFKLKKQISEKDDRPRECYNSFGQVLEILNLNRNNCVYHRIKMQ